MPKPGFFNIKGTAGQGLRQHSVGGDAAAWWLIGDQAKTIDD